MALQEVKTNQTGPEAPTEVQAPPAEVPDDIAKHLSKDLLQTTVNPKCLVSSSAAKGPPATGWRPAKAEAGAPKAPCHVIHIISLEITTGHAHPPLSAEIFVATAGAQYRQRQDTSPRSSRLRHSVGVHQAQDSEIMLNGGKHFLKFSEIF
jgi:hypothetical protein